MNGGGMTRRFEAPHAADGKSPRGYE